MRKAIIFFAVAIILMAIPYGEPYQRKSFSILGDSWSTYRGFAVPEDHQWYPASDIHCEGYGTGNDVISVAYTWWGKLQADFHMVENRSYSGSPICYDGYGDGNDDAREYSFVQRVNDLNMDADFIVIQGGINDGAAGAEAGEYKWSDWTEADFTTFRPSLAYVLDYLQTHTDATLIFLKSEITRADIAESIDVICDHYGVHVVYPIGVDLMAWHPDIRGMLTIYNTIRPLFGKR